jgi:hypothetical protein
MLLLQVAAAGVLLVASLWEAVDGGSVMQLTSHGVVSLPAALTTTTTSWRRTTVGKLNKII